MELERVWVLVVRQELAAEAAVHLDAAAAAPQFHNDESDSEIDRPYTLMSLTLLAQTIAIIVAVLVPSGYCFAAFSCG